MNKLLYLFYCLIFMTGVNLVIFFSLYGFLIFYDFSHPIFSLLIDHIIFIVLVFIPTYLSSVLLLWGYYGIKKLKRRLYLEPIKQSITTLKYGYYILFLFVFIPGIFFYGAYDEPTKFYALIILYSSFVYLNIITLCYLCISSIYQADVIELEFENIIQNDEYNVIGSIMVFVGILTFLFVILVSFFAILINFGVSLDYSLLTYGLLAFLYYPVFILGIVLLMIYKRKRVAAEFFFTERFIKLKVSK